MSRIQGLGISGIGFLATPTRNANSRNKTLVFCTAKSPPVNSKFRSPDTRCMRRFETLQSQTVCVTPVSLRLFFGIPEHRDSREPPRWPKTLGLSLVIRALTMTLSDPYLIKLCLGSTMGPGYGVASNALDKDSSTGICHQPSCPTARWRTSSDPLAIHMHGGKQCAGD